MAVREQRGQKPLEMPRRITVTVGVHGDAGAQAHGSGSGAANDVSSAAANDTQRGLTVADVATFHEFGVGPFRMKNGAQHPGIPQRSFVRAWFDESQPFIVATLQAQMQLVVAGKLSAEMAGERIALAFEGSMKERLSRGIPPPNAPSTVAAKGSSKPLINRGQLRNAIRGQAVVETAGAELGGAGASGAEAAE